MPTLEKRIPNLCCKGQQNSDTRMERTSNGRGLQRLLLLLHNITANTTPETRPGGTSLAQLIRQENKSAELR